MIELLTQLGDINISSQPAAAGPVAEFPGNLLVRIMLPDELLHQELVEIRIEHGPHDGIERKTVIIGSGCKIHSVYPNGRGRYRSEEHTSELQSLMRISYAGFCL